MAVEFISATSISTGNSIVNVSYPAVVNANDILLIHVCVQNKALPVLPSGWSLLNDESGGFSWAWAYGIFWKRATGSESGSVAVSVPFAGFGVMYQFAGCVTSGNPYTSIITDPIQGQNSTILTFAGLANHLKVAIHNVADDLVWTNNSDADWTLRDEQNSAVQNDCSMAVLTSVLVASSKAEMSMSDISGATGFLLIPSGINIKINIGDVWKGVDAIKINIGDVWKDVVAVKQNIGDVWKDV